MTKYELDDRDLQSAFDKQLDILVKGAKHTAEVKKKPANALMSGLVMLGETLPSGIGEIYALGLVVFAAELQKQGVLKGKQLTDEQRKAFGLEQETTEPVNRTIDLSGSSPVSIEESDN